MARAATSPELALYRTPGKWSVLRCAILKPPIVYRARINQTFSSLDQVIVITYDGGSGTLADVLPDMEVWIGSSLDAHDKGICRLRDKDATHFYLSETSDINFANDDYVTILAGFQVWARPVRIAGDGTVYMDETTYTNQHSAWDPMPNMGPHQVLELTGATVNATFNASSSFCPGSSIAAWSWSCSTASGASGATTSTPTFQFNTVGWHIVYLTITSGAGKTFFGVRYVYVWDQDHQTPGAEILNPGHCDVDSGGWEIELRLYDADLADIYDRAMVILFSEDHYGDTVQAIGPVAGSENIRFIGWISSETHHIESEQGSVTFKAHNAAYWMTKIPSWPDGVKITAGAASWTGVPGLTVDLGMYHHLRWRSTITRIMDVTLTGDTRYSPEVSSGAQNLWAQLQNMTWAQIYARVGVNYLNQLSVQIHPALIPLASRTAPTVMAITKADYADGLDCDREIIPEVGIVDMSGIAVDSGGTGSAYFALAPGHSLPHYGDWDIQPNLLLQDQAQVITQASLYRAMKNNPLKAIPIVFDAPISLIDCWPNQKCTIDIQPGDNVRGITYNGGLFPVSVDLVQDPDTGYCHTEVTFEAETSESGSRAMQGDTPGSGSTAGPVTPSLPPLPFPPIIIPGVPGSGAAGVTTVVVHDTSLGFIYTTNFDNPSPTWLFMNAGLSMGQYQNANFIRACPNGVLYAGIRGTGSSIYLARSPGAGQAWTIVEDYTSLSTRYGTSSVGIIDVAVNRLIPENIAYVAGSDVITHIYVGSNGSYAQGSPTTAHDYFNTTRYAQLGFGSLSFGGGQWRFTGSYYWGWWRTSAKTYWLFTPAGGLVTSGDLPEDINNSFLTGLTTVVSGGTTPIAFIGRATGGIYRTVNNFQEGLSLAFIDEDLGMVGLACDDTGYLLMGRWGGNKGFSSDQGTTWGPLPNLPPGVWAFVYAGPGSGAASSRWIAFSGTDIEYTESFGNIWQNRMGNMYSINSFQHLDAYAVVGF